ncbi:hypothetical protein TELCIR_16274, partial [Teladorsagia circumcincta]
SGDKTITAEPVQNTTEVVAFKGVDQQPLDTSDEEDTKHQKTAMFLIIMGVLALIHVFLISLLILSCRCYVTRRGSQKTNKKTAGGGGRYSQMKQPQKVKKGPLGPGTDQQQSDTLDLWTDRRPSDTRLHPSR